MRVSIGEITSVINKISDLTSGDKQVPGVMLDLSDNLLKVCYTDGHKAFVEHIEVNTNETDKFEPIVVEFESIKRAISNCQPSGIIKVEEIEFTYKDKVVTISADQSYDLTDAEGNVVGSKTLANKKMDLAWKEPSADIKSSILTRMNYDSIFESEITDEFDKKELLDALSRTSVEKGKQIYISSKTQTVFVANQAHVTSVPLSKLTELTTEEQDEIRAGLNESGSFTEESFKAEIAKRENRVHFSVIMTQSIAKAITGIFNKTSADKVYLFTNDRFCNIFIDTEDEHIGLWFEMAQASKAHIGALERYNSLKYNSYHTMFLRDFLMDNLKSASNVTKSEKVQLKFEDNDGEKAMVIAAGSASASVADTYKVIMSYVVDPDNNLESKILNVSLPVLIAMIEQLKTTYIAMDMECSPDGSTCLRLAEVDYDKMRECHAETRRKTQELCKEQNIEFDENSTPTPVEFKLEFRLSTLLAKQFTMLAK